MGGVGEVGGVEICEELGLHQKPPGDDYAVKTAAEVVGGAYLPLAHGAVREGQVVHIAIGHSAVGAMFNW